MTDSFNSFGLNPKLMQALARMQFTTPTPVQAEAIPLALQGRDILGSAQTGTGKTGAFGIPVIHHLIENPEAAALVMTPTRELASQVLAAMQQMIPVAGINTALLIGGEPMPRQFRQLDRRPRLIVGTPGRINDHLQKGTLKLHNAAFLVLDETDRMLDMGFGVQIERIVGQMPQARQTMLFSATLPANITKLSAKYLNEPARVAVGSTTNVASKVTQELVQTTDGDKYNQLVTQLEARNGSVIIFIKTKYGTERMAKRLTEAGHVADAIHGDLQQKKRDRVIQAFRDKKFRVLVATDVAARGLDIPHIEHVINYDMPQCPEDYIHRIGRTARAGAQGAAVNLITPADRVKWRAIHKLMHGNNSEPEGFAAPKRQYNDGGKKKFFGKGQGGKPWQNRSEDGGQRENKPWQKKKFFDKSQDGADMPRTDMNRDDKPANDMKREYTPRERNFGDEAQGNDRPRREFRPRGEFRPRNDRPQGDRPQGERTYADRAERGERPQGERPQGERFKGPRPEGRRPYGERPQGERVYGERKFGPRTDDRAQGDRAQSDRPEGGKFYGDKPQGEKWAKKPWSDKPKGDRPFGDRTRADGQQGDKPYAKDGKKPFGKKPFGKKPFGNKSEGGQQDGDAKGGKPFNKAKKPWDNKKKPYGNGKPAHAA